MAVAFPAGYSPVRSIDIADRLNVHWEEMDDGDAAGQVLGTTGYSDYPITLQWLTQAEMQTIRSFVLTNQAEDITWTIDGIDFIGNITSDLDRTMNGNVWSLSFTYHARENV